MESEDNSIISHSRRKIFQVFLDFMTRITKFEELVNVGNRFLVSFQQGLDFLQRPPIDMKSELLGQIIKANQSKRLSSYIEAGCVNTNDSKQNLSKSKSVVKELESLLDEVTTVIENYNEGLPHLQDKDVHCKLDSSLAIAGKEELKQLASDLQKPGITDYAILMGVIYGMVKQDYNMQERIISSLSLKSSSGELESYCLMWSLRPFIDDEIMHQAWSFVP